MTAAFRPDPDAACDDCGAAGAFRFEGEALCADCYAGRGSCCSPEFSGRPPTRELDRDAITRASPPANDGPRGADTLA